MVGLTFKTSHDIADFFLQHNLGIVCGNQYIYLFPFLSPDLPSTPRPLFFLLNQNDSCSFFPVLDRLNVIQMMDYLVFLWNFSRVSNLFVLMDFDRVEEDLCQLNSNKTIYLCIPFKLVFAFALFPTNMTHNKNGIEKHWKWSHKPGDGERVLIIMTLIYTIIYIKPLSLFLRLWINRNRNRFMTHFTFIVLSQSYPTFEMAPISNGLHKYKTHANLYCKSIYSSKHDFYVWIYIYWLWV